MEGERGKGKRGSNPVLIQSEREQGRLPGARAHAAVSANELFLKRITLQRKLEGHGGCVNTVAFTPDGHTLVSGSDDRLVKLWNWELGKQVLSFNSGHWANVFQARALPESGGSVIVSSGADGQIRLAHLLEGSSQSVVSGQIGRHEGRAHKIALLDTPWALLSCGEDGVVLHFDLRQRSPSNSLAKVRGSSGQVLEVYSVACNPLAPWQFCVGGQDHTVRVFDLRKSAAAAAGEERGNGVSATPLCSLVPRRLFVRGNELLDAQVTCAVYSKRGEILASYNNEAIFLFSANATNGTERDPRELNRRMTVPRDEEEDGDDEAGPSSGKRQQKHERHQQHERSSKRSRVRESRGDRVASALAGEEIQEDAMQPPEALPPRTRARRETTRQLRSPHLEWLLRRGARAFNHPDPHNRRVEDGIVVMRRFSPSPAQDIPELATIGNDAHQNGDAAAGAAEGSVVWRLQRGGRGLASTGAGGGDAAENEGEFAAADEERPAGSFWMSESEGEEEDSEEESSSDEEGGDRYGEDRRHMMGGPSVDGWMAERCDLASSVLQRPGGVLQTYRGHRNQQTIKGVAFFGENDEYVLSGSDDGYIYFWNAATGAVISCLHGDSHVVNCLERHPHDMLTLATSGIDDDAKIWAPTADKAVGLGVRDRYRLVRNTSQCMWMPAASEAVNLSALARLLPLMLGASRGGRESGEEEGSEEADEEEEDEFW